MGCGCSGESIKKADKNIDNDVAGGLTIGDMVKRGLGGLGAFLIATVLLPVMWIAIMVAMYKSWFHGGFELGSILSKLKPNNNTKSEDEEEINPEDYVLVGVDKEVTNV